MNKSEPYLTDIKDYIQVYKNAVPDELCNRIIKEYKDCANLIDAQVGGGQIRKDIRNVRNLNISEPVIIEENKEIRQQLDKDLYVVVAKMLEKYREFLPHSTIAKDSGYVFLEYKTGGFYTQHTDNYTIFPRAISCSLNLNDDYTGGEFGFFDNTVSYSLGKGDVIMFPSNFMYPHEIRPVLSGTRYSIITWFD
jgi:predicted 2-oxoglutarate/Fe(II)-dependent dioxygenase YbiX